MIKLSILYTMLKTELPHRVIATIQFLIEAVKAMSKLSIHSWYYFCEHRNIDVIHTN